MGKTRTSARKLKISEDISERLKDPKFNIDEWIEEKNKALAHSLSEEYRRNFEKKG